MWYFRELHRLREQWQARGKDQSLTALAGRSADSSRGQSLQQLRQSLLTQQHSRLQATSAPDRPQGIMPEHSLKRQGQGRPEEPNSPSSRSCSPRCRVAKGETNYSCYCNRTCSYLYTCFGTYALCLQKLHSLRLSCMNSRHSSKSHESPPPFWFAHFCCCTALSCMQQGTANVTFWYLLTRMGTMSAGSVDLF